MWTLPCSTELNVTYLFSNVSYPVHPLDTVTSAFRGPADANGDPTCVGAFQPISLSNQGFDIILGMSFCTLFHLTPRVTWADRYIQCATHTCS